MAVDFFLFIITCVLVYMGWRDGMLMQCLNLASIVLGIALSPVFATELRELFFGGDKELTTPTFEATTWAASAIGLSFGFSLIGRFIIWAVRRASTTLELSDRIAGLLLGIVKAALIAYVIVTAAIMLERPLRVTDEKNVTKLRDGYATSFFKQQKIFLPWQLPAISDFHKMLLIGSAVDKKSKSADKKAKLLREKHQDAADFLRRDEVRALVRKKELQEAADENDWATTMADASVRKFFNDKKLYDAMRAISWDEVFADVFPEKETPSTSSEKASSEKASSEKASSKKDAKGVSKGADSQKKKRKSE